MKSTKSFFGMFILVSGIGQITFAETPASIWSLRADVEAPESVYFDSNSGFVYISNISGDGTARDGKGWIQKVSPTGKVIEKKWVSGLDAPKGMRSHNGVLWVTDIDTLVSVDVKTGKILKKFKQEGAKFFNDIAITQDGTVFLTDTIDRKIYQLKNNKLEVFFEGDETESPNGLLIQGDKLIVSAWGLAKEDWSVEKNGRLYSLDLKTKAKKLITKEPLGNLDGLELRSNGNYLVSDWSKGIVYEISPKGSVSKILDLGKKGLADIGYMPSTDTLLVPQMVDSSVEAYDMKRLGESKRK